MSIYKKLLIPKSKIDVDCSLLRPVMRLTDFFMQIIKACLMISIISSDSSRLIASWFRVWGQLQIYLDWMVSFYHFKITPRFCFHSKFMPKVKFLSNFGQFHALKIKNFECSFGRLLQFEISLIVHRDCVSLKILPKY